MIGFFLILALRAASAAEADSYCVVAGTPTSGVGSCDNGDVFLKGDYIQLGMHNAFSLGTSENAPAGYVRSGQQLALIADFDKNGWTGYSGDYVLPGSALEGWSISYNGTVRANAALEGHTDIATTSFDITSTPTVQSAEWVGSTDDLTISQNISFDNDGLIVTVDVTIENTGSQRAEDIWYTRIMDPDQEYDEYGDYITLNYVRYQASGPADYINSGQPTESIVFAVGINNEEFVLGLRAIDSRSHVRHGGGENFDAIDLFVSGSDKDDWQSFGGANIRPLHEDSGDMDRADDMIHVGFDLGDILPGDSVSFSYSYLLSHDGYISPLSANHIYVQLLDVHGDGWDEDLKLAVYHDDDTEPELYSLHCACKIVRLFSDSDSGDMRITLYRNNTDEPGPRGKHVPFEWEALYTLSFNDGTTSTPLGVYGDVDTVIEIRNWNITSTKRALDINENAPKNKCIPPPPPKMSPSDADDAKPKPPPSPPTTELSFTIYESDGNSWCDDSGDTHVTTCSAYSYYSRDPSMPNILTYPRYYFSDHDGRLLLEQGTLRKDLAAEEKTVTLPRDGSFVFSVSGHYLGSGNVTWDFCGVSGNINEKVYFRTRAGLCELINVETVSGSLSCENEWTTGFLLTQPIVPLEASKTLQAERYAIGVLEIVAVIFGVVALAIIVKRKFPQSTAPLISSSDATTTQTHSRKVVKFQSVDTTEHNV